MIRAIPFGLILVLTSAVVFWIGRKIDFEPQVVSFVEGFAIPAVTGFAWFRLVAWWGTVTRPGKKQTVTLKTEETPRQIMWAMVVAACEAIVFCGALIAALIWFIANEL